MTINHHQRTVNHTIYYYFYLILFMTQLINFKSLHSKNAGLFQPKSGSNMDEPKCWVKNVIKKITVESES